MLGSYVRGIEIQSLAKGSNNSLFACCGNAIKTLILRDVFCSSWLLAGDLFLCSQRSETESETDINLLKKVSNANAVDASLHSVQHLIALWPLPRWKKTIDISISANLTETILLLKREQLKKYLRFGICGSESVTSLQGDRQMHQSAAVWLASASSRSRLVSWGPQFIQLPTWKGWVYRKDE